MDASRKSAVRNKHRALQGAREVSGLVCLGLAGGVYS